MNPSPAKLVLDGSLSTDTSIAPTIPVILPSGSTRDNPEVFASMDALEEAFFERLPSLQDTFCTGTLLDSAIAEQQHVLHPFVHTA